MVTVAKFLAHPILKLWLRLWVNIRIFSHLIFKFESIFKILYVIELIFKLINVHKILVEIESLCIGLLQNLLKLEIFSVFKIIVFIKFK